MLGLVNWRIYKPLAHKTKWEVQAAGQRGEESYFNNNKKKASRVSEGVTEANSCSRGTSPRCVPRRSGPPEARQGEKVVRVYVACGTATLAKHAGRVGYLYLYHSSQLLTVLFIFFNC